MSKRPSPRLRATASLSCFAVLASLAAACGGGGETGTGGGGSGGVGGTGGAGGSATGGGGSDSASLLVDTDKGPVQGALHETTRAFLGIPYAAPPVGDLRWRAPSPAAAWTDPLDATKKGAPCAQNGLLGGGFDAKSKEDCLFVNVWTPSKPASDKLPVLVWIHGGAFELGSGSDKDYDGQVLSQTTGAVVVNMNYRLGPLGFLGLDALAAESDSEGSTGTYGLQDQRAALAWVKANIAAFGGDPGKVMLFGESAGGISTCMHLVSPASEGLFQSAVIESGPCDNATTLEEANTQGAAFITALGCDGEADVPACLRSKPVEEVLAALPTSPDFFFGDQASWFPVVDGVTLPKTPGELLAAGQFSKVPVILGSNGDEGSIFIYLAGDAAKVETDAEFEAFVEGLLPGHGADIVANYPSADYGSPQAAATAALGDAVFVCAARRTARALSAAGVDTFLYHFTFKPGSTLLGDLGSFHSAEVKYVFGNPTQLLPGALSEEETTLSESIMGYWSRHADKGDPNGEGALEWPSYSAATDQSLHLDTTLSTETGLKKDLCDFWDTIGNVGK